MASPALRARAKKLRQEATGGTSRLAGAGGAGGASMRSTSETGQSYIKAARSGTGKLWVQVLGGILLLSLIYLLVAGKGSQVIGKLVDAIANGVRALISPVDPIAHLESAFGATPIAAAQGGGGASPSSEGTSAATPSPNAAGYVAPFTGAKSGRIDQGQDFSLTPGAPIRAVGDGKITAIIPSWFKGQPLIAEQLESGPDKGKTTYVAEQITPSVHVGQRVRAGQIIAHYARSGTGLEWGWGTPSGQTLAQSTTGYIEGQVTAAGQSAASFLHALGVD